MNYKTILITGGAGFVGSNLAVSFKKKYPDREIIALDNLKRRGSELNIRRLNEEGVYFIHGDIRTPEDLAFDKKIDLLIDCSAEPSVLSGFTENPAYIVNTNLNGTLHCLELARKNESDIIFLSTSRVYPFEIINSIKTIELKTRFDWQDGQNMRGWTKEGINEDFQTDGPKTFYGATKLCSEILLKEYLNAYNLKGVINRCGVIAGPWQFGKVDQGIFAFWMLAHYFRKNLKYIGFAGKGKQVRDVIHIDDLFELIELEAASLDKINGNMYNVGGGRDNSLSLLETTKLCEGVTGNRLAIKKTANNRPGDIGIYVTDNRKVNRDLGWHPKRPKEKIVQDIYRWIHNNERQLKESLF